MRVAVRLSLIGYLAIAMALTSSVGSAPGAGPDREGSGTDVSGAVNKIERYVERLEEARARASRQHFDPEALAEKIGDDHEGIFRWVRDNTSLLPYQGVLRGPAGVLMDRVGNSLDRALLLYRLLSLSGHKARLASGRLTQGQAEQLLPKARPLPPSRSTTAQEPSVDEIHKEIDASAKKFDLDARKLRTEFDRVIQEQKRTFQKIEAAVKEQAASITRELKNAGLEPGATSEKERDRIVRALRDHWWVQVQRDGEWIDLDPTSADAMPGTSETAAEKTWDADRLDKSLYHFVKIRVVVEKWSKGRLEETCALEHSLKPAELLGKEIALTHIPMSAPGLSDIEKEKDVARRLERAALEEKEWWPVLKVDRKDFQQSSFTAAGALNRSPGKKSSSPRRPPTGGFFGGLAGGGGADAEESHLTAEWIDYVVECPGGPPRTHRRQVFDILGPAKRRQKAPLEFKLSETDREARAFQLMDRVQINLQSSHLSAEFVIDVVHQRLLNNLEAIGEYVKSGKGTRAKDLIPLADAIGTLPGPECLLALARGMDLPAARGVYVDSPVIISFHDYPSFGDGGGRPAQGGMDVVANPAAPDPRDPARAFSSRLSQGLLDSNLEALIMRTLGPARSTADVFAGAIKAGEKWTAVRSVEDLAARGLSYPPDLQARVESDLEEGFWVIVPEKWTARVGAGSFGWWRLDPGSGAILGMGDRGWGQATTDYSKTTEAVVLSHISNAFCLAGLVRSGAESGGSGKGIEDAIEFMCCLAFNKGTSSFGNLFRYDMARDLSYLFFGYTAGSFFMTPIDICNWF